MLQFVELEGGISTRNALNAVTLAKSKVLARSPQKLRKRSRVGSSISPFGGGRGWRLFMMSFQQKKGDDLLTSMCFVELPIPMSLRLAFEVMFCNGLRVSEA